MPGFANRAGRLFGRPFHRAALAFLLSVVLAVPAGLAAGWEKKIFKGETVYAPVIDEGRPALKAESRAAASALIYRVSLEPKVRPRLSWSWKIVRTIGKGD